MIWPFALTALLLSAQSSTVGASPPPEGTLYADAPEVRLIPKLAVWITLQAEAGMGSGRTYIDIGKMPATPKAMRDAPWFVKRGFSGLGGDGEYAWAEAAVPQLTDAIECPALPDVIQKLEQYVRRAKPQKADITPDSGEIELTVFPDYTTGGDREQVYGVTQYEKGRDDLRNLLNDSMDQLEACFPTPLKMYPLAKPFKIPDPIQVAPYDPPRPPPVPWTLPEPDPPKAN